MSVRKYFTRAGLVAALSCFGAAGAGTAQIVPGRAQPAANLQTTQSVNLSKVARLGTVNISDLAARARAAATGPAAAPLSARTVARRQPLRHRLPSGLFTAAGRPQTTPVAPTRKPTVGVHGVSQKSSPASPQSEKSTATPLGYSKIRGFAGLSTADNASDLEPPDQGLAVNNNVIAEITNVAVNFFDATSLNAHYQTAIPATTFFNDPNAFSDPQVFFDPTLYKSTDTTPASKGRWIFTIISGDPNSAGTGANWYLDIAVSQTSNPFGSYNLYQAELYTADISGCTGGDCLPDYPKAGFDQNGFYVSVNLFDWNTTGNFVNAQTFAFSKAKLRDNTLNAAQRLSYPGDFLVQPSIPAPGQAYDASAGGTAYLLEAYGGGVLRVWALTNTKSLDSGGLINGQGVALNVNPSTGPYADYTNPAAEPNVPGPYCASQSLAAPHLDGGYVGFQATVQYASKKIYGVLASANGTNGNYLSWYSITPTVKVTKGVTSLTAKLTKQGVIVPPAGYSLQYPSFGLNKKGAGVIGFSISNPAANVLGNFPSSGYLSFSGTAPGGSLVVTGVGVAADDGFSGCGAVGRWGDYGAAVVDPTTGVMYTGNEMIATPYTKISSFYLTNWGTYITQVTP